MKTPLFWAMLDHDVYGNALGYAWHKKMMKQYSAEYFEYSEDADIALQIISADHFIPVAGKINVLFTMWEFLDLPPSYIEGINKADVLIVPCDWCRDLFRRYTEKPIYVCNEGIEPGTFPFFDRSQNRPNGSDKKFRFLWCGAPNPRKGYEFVVKSIKLFEKMPEIEIYIKTTSKKIDLTNIRERRAEYGDITDEDFEKRIERMIEREPKLKTENLTHFGEHQNIIYDTRKLSFDELVGLYNSAHCFLLPTLGEGWGLTLCEAMATGCPSIALPQTGCAEYFDERVGFGVKYDIITMRLENYGISSRTYLPNLEDFVSKMVMVIQNYDEALKRGKRASERIHKNFTWPQAARRLHDIILEVKANMTQEVCCAH